MTISDRAINVLTAKAPATVPIKSFSADEVNIYQQAKELKKEIQELKKSTSYTFKDVIHLGDRCANLYRDFIESRDQDNWTNWTSQTSKYIDGYFDTIHYAILDCYVFLDKIDHTLARVYNQLVAIQKSLMEMHATKCFSLDSVQSLKMKLNEIENKFCHNGVFKLREDDAIPKGQAILFHKLNFDYKLSQKLMEEATMMSPALVEYHNTLIQLHEKVMKPSAANMTRQEINLIQYQLRELEPHRKDGFFVDKKGEILPGDAVLAALMEEVYAKTYLLISLQENVAPELEPLQIRLIKVRDELQQLLEKRWTIQLQDLMPYHQVLSEIESQRKDGIFMKSDNGSIPMGQAVIHTLLHQAHRSLYRLQCILEPVHPLLEAIQYDLLQVRKVLLYFLHNGQTTDGEMTHIRKVLDSFHEIRVDGKYIVDEEVLPGQEALNALLNECYDIWCQIKYASIIE